MKKYVLFFLTLISTGLNSCKKEDSLNHLNGKSHYGIEKIRAFYENHFHQTQANPKTIRSIEGKPDWNNAFLINDHYFIPVKLDIKKINNEISITKFLAISESYSGMKGEYVYILHSKTVGNNLIDSKQLIDVVSGKYSGKSLSKGSQFCSAKNKSNKHEIGNFIQYKFGKQKLIKKGYETDTTIVANSAPIESCTANGGTMVEIEWWYQEYDNNGVLIFEEYIFSTYECWGSGGSGGGGTSGPTDLQFCQYAVTNTLNATTPSNETVSNVLMSETGLTRNRMYAWKCLKNTVGWYVIAYDHGVHSRKNTNSDWKWTSLTNISISKNGTTPAYNGSVSVTKVSGLATIGLYHAIMHLVIRVDVTVSKNGFSVTNSLDYNAPKTWNIDATPMIGY